MARQGRGASTPGRAHPQPRDVRFIPVPGQDEQRLPVTPQAAGVLPGADLLPPGQQPRNEQDEFPGHVESDTIGDQRGVSRQADFFWRDFFYRELRAFPAMFACVRVSACMGVIRLITDSALLRKPHCPANPRSVDWMAGGRTEF